MLHELEDDRNEDLEKGPYIKEASLKSEQKKPKKYLGIILILLVIAIIAIGSVFFYMKKPEEIIAEEVPNLIVDFLNTDLAICMEAERKPCKAVNTNNISICQNSSNEEKCIGEYYFFNSLQENENDCNKIKNNTLASFCEAVFNNQENCSGLEGELLILCEVIVGVKDPQSCAAMANPNASRACEGMKFLVNAVKEKELTKCDSIEDGEAKALCSGLVKNDINACNPISLCFPRVRPIMENMTKEDCGDLNWQEARDYCYKVAI